MDYHRIPIVTTSLAGLSAKKKPEMIGNIILFTLFLGTIICLLELPIYLSILQGSIGQSHGGMSRSIVFGIPSLVGLLISGTRGYLLHLYGIEDVPLFQEWTDPFSHLLPFMVLLDAITSRIIGEMHFYDEYKELAVQKFLIALFIETPIMFFGVYTHAPEVFWLSRVVAQSLLVSILIMRINRVRARNERYYAT